MESTKEEVDKENIAIKPMPVDPNIVMKEQPFNQETVKDEKPDSSKDFYI